MIKTTPINPIIFIEKKHPMKMKLSDEYIQHIRQVKKLNEELDNIDRKILRNWVNTYGILKS